MNKEQRTIKPKIVFMGTPNFAATILETIVRCSLFTVCCVVTAPDKPVGRKKILTSPPAKVLAQKYNIPVAQPERIKNYELGIRNLNPDLIIVAAYGQIIPKNILDIPKFGCLNVHPSLLPRWRGPSPIQYTILNGDKKTGVTIILMDEKADHGPIVVQRQLEFPMREEISAFFFRLVSLSRNSASNFQFPKLNQALASLGAKLLIETLSKWIAGEIKPKPQDDSKATYTKILKKEDGKIDWKKSAQELERQIRAFDPWPSSYCKWQMANGKLLLLKILETDINNGELFSVKAKRRIGEVFMTDDRKLAVRTGQNCLILQKLQLEGKRPMSSEEFLRGHQDFIGTVLK